MSLRLLALVATATAMPSAGLAHPGGTNAEGCHNNRRTGDYHCHGSRPSRARSYAVATRGGGEFRNCSEARSTGAAPVRRGQPGYGRHLDRDGDGVGCE